MAARSLRARLEPARVRAGWRALVPVVVLLAAGAVLGALFRGLPTPYDVAATQAVIAALAVALFVVWSRYVDHRPPEGYGLALDRRWLSDLAAGVAVGGGLVGCAVASGVALDWLRVTEVHPGSAVSPPLLAFAAAFAGVAVWEELAFRALALTNAAEGLRRWFDDRAAVLAAWVVVSVAFGLLHADQAPTPSAITVWIVAGSVPGLAYVLTGSLGYAVGFHFAVDAAVNAVFNLGGADVPSVVAVAHSGPEVMVGATGALVAGWLLAAVPLTLAWAVRRNGGLSVDAGVGGR